jgi:uncharacterized membrane protein YqgA involved in biofilm formation
MERYDGMIIGTVVNSAAIIIGGLTGMMLMAKVGASVENSAAVDGVTKILGLSVVVLGMKMATAEHGFLSVAVALCLGTLLGELVKLENHVKKFGLFLKGFIKTGSTTFVDGFVTASVLYCVGATAILGALRDGLMNDPSLLFVKSLLDGVMSVILASMLGVGVLFSALPVFIYQGVISFAASGLSFMMENSVYVNGISAVGGIMVLGIGMNIVGFTKLRIANTLPSLALIPLLDALVILAENL